jgi:Domain of unknown function (DUF4160)
MPVLSRFFGVVITMYYRDHAPPHFHARYGSSKAKFRILDGQLIAGELPPRMRSIVEEWRKAHIAQLNEAWEACQQRRPPMTIEPLE